MGPGLHPGVATAYPLSLGKLSRLHVAVSSSTKRTIDVKPLDLPGKNQSGQKRGLLIWSPINSPISVPSTRGQTKRETPVISRGPGSKARSLSFLPVCSP